MAKRFIFTYRFCNDLPSMKRFYRDVLDLPLIWEDENSLGFKVGDHQITFELIKNLPTPEERWSIQPGWQGGTEARVGWSLECNPGDFQEIVRRATEIDARRYLDQPQWVGYWSFPLMDPMNATIEITCSEEDGWVSGQ